MWGGGSKSPASQDLWLVALPGERGLLDTPRDGAHCSTEIQDGPQTTAPEGPRSLLAALPPPREARLRPVAPHSHAQAPWRLPRWGTAPQLRGCASAGDMAQPHGLTRATQGALANATCLHLNK